MVHRRRDTGKEVEIREFRETDADDVVELFVKINRLLAPPHLSAAFETYIEISIEQEIGRISDYFANKGGQFWVAVRGGTIAGMFGLEPSGDSAMELRRMYVDPELRRRGIAGQMLRFAEDYCRTHNITRLDLSTSELQPDALSFYRKSGYTLVQEVIADAISNKTIGAGIKRFHFMKKLDQS